MIKALVRKVEWSGTSCDNKECAHNPEYHDQVLRSCFLKQGQPCLVIANDKDDWIAIYCRECVDILYKQLKPALDSKLWIFS